MNAQAYLNKVINNEQVYLWLISFVLISLPLAHNINSIFIILLFLFSFSFYLINKRKIKFEFRPIIILFVCIYILAIASLFWSVNINKSFQGLTQKLSYLIIPLLFLVSPDIDPKKINRIFYNFSFAIVLYSIYCLSLGFILFFKTGDKEYLFYHNLSQPLNDINAIYMSMYTAFALLYFFLKKEKQKRDFVFLSILSVFLILLSSKVIITLTSLLIVLSIFFIKKGNRSKRLKTILIVCVLILTILSTRNIINRFNTEIENTKITEIFSKNEFGQVYHWTGTSLRLFQIRVFFELLREDKIFLNGYGIDASESRLQEKYEQYNLFPGFYQYNLHNQYLQVFSELGFIGLLLLFSIFYTCFKNAILKKDFLFFSFLLLVSILCFTESYLWRQRGMVFFITTSLLFSKMYFLKGYVQKV